MKFENHFLEHFPKNTFRKSLFNMTFYNLVFESLFCGVCVVCLWCVRGHVVELLWRVLLCVFICGFCCYVCVCVFVLWSVFLSVVLRGVYADCFVTASLLSGRGGAKVISSFKGGEGMGGREEGRGRGERRGRREGKGWTEK